MNNPYQKFYTRWYKNKSVIDNHKIEIMKLRKKLNEIAYSPTNKILDIACGISVFGKTFGDQVYGIDLNPQAVKFANKNGIKATLGNIEKKWKFPAKYFDIVICSHIIEHLINPDHLLEESKRVLKDGGLLIIATPNLAAWFNRLLLLIGVQPFFTEVSTKDKTLGLTFTRSFTKSRKTLGHLRVFTLAALKDILNLHRFTILSETGHYFPAFPLFLRGLDTMFSFFPSLASNIIVVGQKNPSEVKDM